MMEPGTPLPWYAGVRESVGEDGETAVLLSHASPGDVGYAWEDEDAAYIVHAASRHLQLVEALRNCIAALDSWENSAAAQGMEVDTSEADAARSLLAELGEGL